MNKESQESREFQFTNGKWTGIWFLSLIVIISLWLLIFNKNLKNPENPKIVFINGKWLGRKKQQRKGSF